MFRNRFLEVAQPVTGYELDAARSFFSVVVPTGTDQTNLAPNPSGETGTTGYAIITGGSVAQDITEQKFGAASIKCIPGATATDGCKYGDFALVSGSRYYFSTWFKGTSGLKYKLSAVNNAGTLQASTYFTATGYWQRVWVAYTALASENHRLYVQKDNHTDLTPFWIDGLQIELNYLTTYIDGDQRGFIPGRAEYYWNGTPHASTSTRIAQCRAGGQVISLSQIGFRLLAISGLGLGGLVHQLQPLALGGAAYLGTVTSDRQFSLVGQIEAESLAELQRKRRFLIDLFKPDRVSPPQPVRLIYEPADTCGQSLGRPLEIDCLFEGGLEGQVDNFFQERLGLTFRLYLPYTAQEIGDNALGLNAVSTITTKHIAQRSALGQWAVMGTGANDSVLALIQLPDGSIVAGGSFGNMAGLANTKAIARWDGSAWNAMGTGASGGSVLALALGPDGSLYAAGSFALMGGVAGTVGIARWDGTWHALAAGGVDAGKAVYALAFDVSGQLWAGGDFATMNSVADTLRLAIWNGATWHAFGTGADGIVRTLVIAQDVTASPSFPIMYAGGDFSHVFGQDVVGLARLGERGVNQYIWTMNAGVTSGTVQVNSLVFMPDKSLYAGGWFSGIDGVANTGGIARWYNNTWTALGTGLDGAVNGLAYDPYTHQILAAGSFTHAGGKLAPYLATWNGTLWQDLDIVPTAAMYAATGLGTPDGRLFIGFDYSVDTSADVAGVTTVTNNGDTVTRIKLVLTGYAVAHYLRNTTTRKTLYFNYTLLAGETATLDLSGPQLTFTSSMFGNVLDRISGGSQLTEFVLQPGTNVLTLFEQGIGFNATLFWHNRYQSIDGAIPTQILP